MPAKTAQRIADETVKLPVEARAVLAGTLLDSLDEDAAAAWSAKIANRVLDVEDCTVRTVPEVRRTILRGTGATAMKHRSHAALFVGLAILANLSCIEPAGVRHEVIDSGPTTVAPAKGPSLPGGLTVAQVTALVESSDVFLEPKIAICPRSTDHHNIEFWQQQYPALGVLMSQGMVDLSEPGSDPTGYQTVELNAKGRMVDPPITTGAAGYEVTIASRRLLGIIGASPTGNDRYDLSFTWQFVPTEIGKSFRLNTQGRATWVRLELVSGRWRVSDVQLNQGHYGPYDY